MEEAGRYIQSPPSVGNDSTSECEIGSPNGPPGYRITEPINGLPADVNRQHYGPPADVRPAPSLHPLHQQSMGCTQSIDGLLHQVMQISTQSLDQGYESKRQLRSHRLMPLMYEVLCEFKERTGLSLRHAHVEDVQPNAQQMRLDNMLIAEGVVDATASSNNVTKTSSQLDAIQHNDYRTKLETIRRWYHQELEKYDRDCEMFTGHVFTLLKEQCGARPISAKEVDQMVQTVQKKLSAIQIQLKQQTCEAVMSLRSRFLDARRKRRNFSKHASDILNAYFYSHLSNPYPSEEAKEELAKQCEITVSQVSNWFGNKRIRYKKNVNKAQKEANHYAAKKAAASVGGSALDASPYQAGSSSQGTPSPTASVSQDAQNCGASYGGQPYDL